MTRVVADASAVVDVLAEGSEAPAVRAALADSAEIHVPEHFHIEAISALRGLLARNELSPERADRALDTLLTLRVVRHPVAPLTREIWGLRSHLSAYDAAYLALARAINARVLTTDTGLMAAAKADGRAVKLA